VTPGTANFFGGVIVTGPTMFNSGVTAYDATVGPGNLNVYGNISVQDYSLINYLTTSNIIVGGTPGVVSFMANGDSLFEGIASTASVTANNLTVGLLLLSTTSNVVVDGPITANSILAIDGLTTNGGLSTTNASMDQLVVSGQSTLNASYVSNLAVFAQVSALLLNVSQNLTVEQQLLANGGLIISGSSQFTGDVTLTNSLNLTSGANVAALVVNGALTVEQGATINQNLQVGGATILTSVDVTADINAIGNISSADFVNGTQLCIGTDCRTMWPTITSEVLSIPVMLSIKPGAEELFYIGEFAEDKDFSLKIYSIHGTGIFETLVLMGTTDGQAEEFSSSGEKIVQGSFWGSVKRRDNIPGEVSVQVTVLEL